MIRVTIPYHLRNLAGVKGDIELEVSPPVTIRRALDALEEQYPMLRGAIRDYTTQQRRPFLRFFVCQQDWSHESLDMELPEPVTSGSDPLIILGAIAGG